MEVLILTLSILIVRCAFTCHLSLLFCNQERSQLIYVLKHFAKITKSSEAKLGENLFDIPIPQIEERKKGKMVQGCQEEGVKNAKLLVK